MLKKLFVILCSVLIATDSFATTDIASNATTSTCDSGVLGTTQGDVNFDAKWESNNVQLIWHDNHTIIQTAQNTCSYDGTLTIPATEPQRVGYTFAGWHVMPTINASALTSLKTGHERWGVGTVSATNNNKYCWNTVGTGSSVHVDCAGDGFSDLERHEWKAQYTDNTNGAPTGTLYGAAYCSGKSGNRYDATWPAEHASDWLATHTELESASGEKKYCWCQATSWMAEGSSTLQALSSLSSNQPWVFSTAYSSADACASNCAAYCAGSALNAFSFRRALFVGTGN